MASRMGFDLTTKIGWKNLKYQWKSGIQWKYVFTDTFIKFYCKLIGHNEYNSNGERACKRCHHYINS